MRTELGALTRESSHAEAGADVCLIRDIAALLFNY